MNALFKHLSLPLVAKELTEQSAQLKTYVLRVIYAVIVYGVTFWVLWGQLREIPAGSLRLLGLGEPLFLAISWLQFAGIYLFLPAMTCGVLTSEKERDTLGLLLLTRMGPWSIILGKLVGRLLPMATFILLSLPLMTIAYGMGGVDEIRMLKLAWVLGVTLIQVGTLAVACSAWCRTTSASFLATYLIGGALFFGIPIYLEETHLYQYGPIGTLSRAGVQSHVLQGEGDVLGILFGPAIGRIGESSEPTSVRFDPNNIQDGIIGPVVAFVCAIPPLGWIIRQMNSTPTGADLLITFLRSLPALLFSVACLVFARAVLWRRAFVPPSNYLLKVFRFVDALMHRANNNRLTKGIVLTTEHVALPVFDPIAWRETKKRSLGTTRYLVRFLILLEVPVVIAMHISMMSHQSNSSVTLVDLSAWALWIIAALVLTIQSTGLIGLERSRQSLDVLLTTTLSSDQIVMQKFAGVKRLIRTLWVPFGTVCAFQIFCAVFIRSYDNFDWERFSLQPSFPFALVRSILAVAIYLPLVCWIGFHFGMRLKSQTRATLAVLAGLTMFCAIPPILAFFLNRWFSPPITPWQVGYLEFDQTFGPFGFVVGALNWLSPAYVLVMSTDRQYSAYGYYGNGGVWQWMALFLHFGACFALLIFLRSRGMKTFAKYVHRNDGDVVDEQDIERLANLRKKIVGSGVFQREAGSQSLSTVADESRSDSPT